MLITTQDEFADYKIVKTYGLAKGNTIRARHIGKDIIAGLRTIVGGEIDEYTKNRISHRRKAFDKVYTALESLKD